MYYHAIIDNTGRLCMSVTEQVTSGLLHCGYHEVQLSWLTQCYQAVTNLKDIGVQERRAQDASVNRSINHNLQ